MTHLAHDELKAHTIISVYEWERTTPHPLIFDILLENAHPPGLTRTQIEQQLACWLAPCRYRLLEALAEHIAQHMLNE